MTRLEQEVVVVWNAAEDEAIVTVTDPRWKAKLERRGWVQQADWPGIKQGTHRFLIPKSRVSILRPKGASPRRGKPFVARDSRIATLRSDERTPD